MSSNLETKHLLKKVGEKNGLTTFNVEQTRKTSKGDGYLSIITAVTLSDQDKVINLIVKTAEKSDALRKQAPITDVFDREAYLYNKIIPTYQKFEEERKNLPIQSFPKCYLTCLDNKNETIILENLETRGYKLWPRHTPMNEEHVLLVLNEYSHFHAISLAMRNQKPELFCNLTKDMDDVLVKFFSESGKVCKEFCENALAFLNPKSEEYLVFKRFSKLVTQFLWDLPTLVDCYSVILHGDCWTNNFMFAYDNKEIESPTSMAFIDLQISRLGPPVLDVSYFFYACSAKEIIDNYEKYINIYYEKLANNLKKLGSSPEMVYPYSVFIRQWKESARFGLVMSIVIIKLMLSDNDEIPNLANTVDSGIQISNAYNQKIAKANEYQERVKHLIRHFVYNNLL